MPNPFPNEIFGRVQDYLSSQDRDRLATARGVSRIAAAHPSDRADLEKRKHRNLQIAYEEAAMDNDRNRVVDLLDRYGADYIGASLTRPFVSGSQYAPKDPELVRIMLHAIQEAGVSPPSTSRLIDMYIEQPQVLALLVNEFDALSVLREDRYNCRMYAEFLKHQGYDLQC